MTVGTKFNEKGWSLNEQGNRISQGWISNCKVVQKHDQKLCSEERGPMFLKIIEIIVYTLNNLFPITEKNDDNGIFKDSKQTVFKAHKILSLNSHLFHLIETILKKD